VRELVSDARATLRAAVLPLALQAVEDKVLPRAAVPGPALHALVARCRAVPDWRGRKGRDYPLAGLLAMIVLATLCRVVCGQRDLAAFASGLSQAQRRALLCRKGRDGRYQAPKETTFYRILTTVDAALFERVLHEWTEASLGPCPSAERLIAIDGKAQRGSTPHRPDEQKAQLVGAVSFPSGRSLGCELVEQKSNEIPAARVLLKKLGPLDGKIVMLDALHANQVTLRTITQDNGADYLLPIKDNHPALHHAAAQSFPARPSGAFSPSRVAAAAVRYRRK